MTGLACMILAGGAARRMGGTPKGLELLGDKAVLAHVVERVAPQVGVLALNSNADPALFNAFDLPIIPDAPPLGRGPLAGILAAMKWARALGYKQVATVAWDTPFLPADLMARLTQAQQGQSKKSVMAATRDAEGRLWRHPTASLWPTHLHDDLETALAEGTRKVSAWAELHGVDLVEFPTGRPDPFFNINTPEDLAQAQTYLER